MMTFANFMIIGIAIAMEGFEFVLSAIIIIKIVIN